MLLSSKIPEKMIECKLNAKISQRDCDLRQRTYPVVNSHGAITPQFTPCKGCKYLVKPPKEEWPVHAFRRKAGWIFAGNRIRREE